MFWSMIVIGYFYQSFKLNLTFNLIAELVLLIAMDNISLLILSELIFNL